jgi:hypothetical protein
LREGRNAAENIVPTTTGAAIAVTLTLPQLKDKFDGLSIRVPTPVVSLSDVTALLKRDVTVDEINEAFKKAAADPYFQGILGVSEEPLVSSDYIGNSHSGIVDLLLTKVVDGNMIKVMVWYDNEWGYSNRLVELTADAGRQLQAGHEETTNHSGDRPSPQASHEEIAAPSRQAVHNVALSTQSIGKHEEPMLDAPNESKEELLPAHTQPHVFPEPEVLQNHPEPPVQEDHRP